MTIRRFRLTHAGLHLARVGIQEDRARIRHDGGVVHDGTAGDEP